MDQRRVLLVDQNDDFLDGLSSLLGKTRGLCVAGRAHSAAEAIERTAELSPDLVLMDVSLADMSGFQAVPRLKAHRPTPVVLLTSFHESRAVGSAALAAGADGYVCKTEVSDRLLPVIEELLWPGTLPRATSRVARRTSFDGPTEMDP